MDTGNAQRAIQTQTRCGPNFLLGGGATATWTIEKEHEHHRSLI